MATHKYKPQGHYSMLGYVLGYFNYKYTINFVAPTKSSKIIFRRNLLIVQHSGELVDKSQILDLHRGHCHLLGKHLVRKYCFQLQYFHNIKLPDHNHPGSYKLLSNRCLLVVWQECTKEPQGPVRSQCIGY